MSSCTCIWSSAVKNTLAMAAVDNFSAAMTMYFFHRNIPLSEVKDQD